MDSTELFRTNYFKVKDREFFANRMEICGIKEIYTNQEGMVSINGGYMPSSYDEEQEDGSYETVEFDLETEIVKHLTDDSVCVLRFLNNQGARELDAYATAFDSKGEYIIIHLSDIEGMARKKFKDKTITHCSE